MSQHDRDRVDEELEAILDHDDALLATAGDVRSVLHEPEIDPAFMRELRSRVVRERAKVIEERTTRRRWPVLPAFRWPMPAFAAATFVEMHFAGLPMLPAPEQPAELVEPSR